MLTTLITVLGSAALYVAITIARGQDNVCTLHHNRMAPA
jgi:hypothetical protein